MVILTQIINILVWIIIIDALLTWIPQIDRRHPIVMIIKRITEPILSPIRKIIPPEKTGYLDLSPIIAIIVLQIIEMVLQQIL